MRIHPVEAFEEVPSTFALGPPNDLYMAVGSQLYLQSTNTPGSFTQHGMAGLNAQMF